MIGAMMVLTGVWEGAGVFNIEQLDPDRFMDALNKYGLPWQVVRTCERCPIESRADMDTKDINRFLRISKRGN